MFKKSCVCLTVYAKNDRLSRCEVKKLVNKKSLIGILCALLANVIFGFCFIFSKTALKYADPLIISSIRFTIAFLVFNLLLLTKRFTLSFKGKPKLNLIIMGIAQPFLYFIFELYGLSLISSALSGVIIALVPVGVMILSTIFLKEIPTPLQIVCTIISIAGISYISIISNDGSKNHLLGKILVFGAVICASFFNILSRNESKRYTAFEKTYVMTLVGFIGFNLISLIKFKSSFITLSLSALKHSDFVFSILYLAIISSILAFFLYNYSTSKISVVQTASFSNIVTVVTVLAGVIILKETFTTLQFILCAIIVLGVWGVNVFTPKKN